MHNMFELHPQLEADSHYVADLPLCQVRLENVRNFPWLILIPKQNNLTEVHQLLATQQTQLMLESSLCAQALQSCFSVDKINLGALGNIVSQLHWHVVGRRKTDDAWPNPVWGFANTDPYTPCEIEALTSQLYQAIETARTAT